MTTTPAMPEIVSEAEWRSARDALLVKEKEATRLLDDLAAHSPDGWPQTPPYQWWRVHDEYDRK